MRAAKDVIIVGGGLAGLTSAIHLSRAGLQVTIIEKSAFPRHKVCGEYISNEVVPYLQWLGADPGVLNPACIERVMISAVSGKVVEARLPLGGFGISRYMLDHFLLQKALENGCVLMEDTVTGVAFGNNLFTVDTAAHGSLTAKMVLGAYGKRSVLDQQLSRRFLNRRSPWLAVKGHYEGDFPNDLVALHNFSGGYCGVSKVENNIINICYLVNYDIFKRFKNIAAHQEAILYRNIHLKQIFENSRLLFDRPLTISQVSFEGKEKVEDHILMTGDAAGLIHPLCGNGMAIAIHSAKIAAEQVLQFFNDGTAARRNILENNYMKEWDRTFERRMKTGKVLSAIFRKDGLSSAVMKGLVWLPSLLPFIIKQTHGKPLKVYR